MAATSGVVALSGVVASPIVASAVDGAAMAAVECKMYGAKQMSLSSCYQAGSACRHVKQTTVVLTQAAKNASESTCSYCYSHTKSVVLHVATYIHEMSKVVVVVVVVNCETAVLVVRSAKCVFQCSG